MFLNYSEKLNSLQLHSLHLIQGNGFSLEVCQKPSTKTLPSLVQILREKNKLESNLKRPSVTRENNL